MKTKTSGQGTQNMIVEQDKTARKVTIQRQTKSNDKKLYACCI